jgi:hypothetical protein
MRATLMLAVALSAMATLWPSGAIAQQFGQDSVTGTFTVSSPPLEFSIDAHSGPSGEDPQGTFITAPSSSSPTPYSVICLHVTGNIAVVGIDQVNDNLNAYLRFEDASVDTFALGDTWFGPPSPDQCSRDQSFSSGFSVTAGDIAVVDAPPLPTTKDQCRSGDWRTYGVFKNQGDCVSFVASGGKNPTGNGS